MRTTRSSIAMREEANHLNDLLQASVRHQNTLSQAQMVINLKEERIQKLTDHIHNLMSILDQAFDSDESIFVNEELEQIVDALKYASIARPDIMKGRTGWIEKMETRINDLPY
jgi:hypothetical protein